MTSSCRPFRLKCARTPTHHIHSEAKSEWARDHQLTTTSCRTPLPHSALRPSHFLGAMAPPLATASDDDDVDVPAFIHWGSSGQDETHGTASSHVARRWQMRHPQTPRCPEGRMTMDLRRAPTWRVFGINVVLAAGKERG